MPHLRTCYHHGTHTRAHTYHSNVQDAIRTVKTGAFGFKTSTYNVTRVLEHVFEYVYSWRIYVYAGADGPAVELKRRSARTEIRTRADTVPPVGTKVGARFCLTRCLLAGRLAAPGRGGDCWVAAERGWW
jgi:hypothetical protein